MNEIYALEVEATKAKDEGRQIDATNAQTTYQGENAIRIIHAELVTLREGQQLPAVSEKTWLKRANPRGLQWLLNSLKNKFRSFSSRDQQKEIEASITEFRKIIKIERTTFLQSAFDSVKGLFSSAPVLQKPTKLETGGADKIGLNDLALGN